MTLRQYHALKLWHSSHRHPLEKTAWEAVLTVWMMAWAGLPAAWLLDLLWVQLACVAMFFLPPAYVAWRDRLHQAGRLRCDWITALR
jgi:hypothetical protein